MELSDVLHQPVFRRSDLVAAGMSERTVRRRVADGTFIRVGPGLLCHRGVDHLAETKDLAAHLRWDEPLTGPSAARFFPPGPVSERVPYTDPWLISSRRTRMPAVRVAHPRPETVTRKAVTVASPRQGALDCLRVLPLDEARDLVFRCVQQRLLTSEDVGREAHRLSRYHGAPQLRLLSQMVDTNAHAESERLFHRSLLRAGLRGWQANLWVMTPAGRFCIDIAFEAEMLAIEFDSPVTHGDPARFRGDRRKWNALKRAGWTVVNYTWDSVTEHWAETEAEIRFFLGR